jgi:hypothetical protein
MNASLQTPPNYVQQAQNNAVDALPAVQEKQDLRPQAPAAIDEGRAYAAAMRSRYQLAITMGERAETQ